MTFAPVFLSSRQMIGLSSMKMFGGCGRKDCEYRAFPLAPTLAVHWAPRTLMYSGRKLSKFLSAGAMPVAQYPEWLCSAL